MNSTGKRGAQKPGPPPLWSDWAPETVGNVVSRPSGMPRLTDFESEGNDGQQSQAPGQQRIVGNRARLQQYRGLWVITSEPRRPPGGLWAADPDSRQSQCASPRASRSQGQTPAGQGTVGDTSQAQSQGILGLVPPSSADPRRSLSRPSWPQGCPMRWAERPSPGSQPPVLHPSVTGGAE